jgi:hypothetical protein
METSVSVNNSQGLSCQVELVTVDERRVRIVAFFVFAFALLFIGTGKTIIPIVLLIDFLLRAFNLQAWSPLALISGAVAKQLDIKPKPVDRAPKRFAAFLGVAFLLAVAILSATGFSTAATVLAGVMVVFAALESFVAFCAGCYIYQLIGRFRTNG